MQGSDTVWHSGLRPATSALEGCYVESVVNTHHGNLEPAPLLLSCRFDATARAHLELATNLRLTDKTCKYLPIPSRSPKENPSSQTRTTEFGGVRLPFDDNKVRL